MKDKIRDISNEIFRNERYVVSFSTMNITMLLGEGEIYKGSFAIRENNGKSLRGLLYTSSQRLSCKESGFDGSGVSISYTYDAKGLEPGFVEKGTITLVCNAGEFEIAFTVVIEKPYFMTSVGKVQNLESFRKLAQMNYAEAHKLFKSREFYDIIKYEEKEVYYLYDNMRKWSLDMSALEEFLVAVKRKEKVFLNIGNKQKKVYTHLDGSIKDVLAISKNTWGFLPIKISAKGDFVKITKEELNALDFIGKNYTLEYVIQETKLARGRNFGQILLETPYETIVFTIVVEYKKEDHEKAMEIRNVRIQLMQDYLAFLKGSINITRWSAVAKQWVEQLQTLEPENNWYQLFLVHIYIDLRMIKEAQWILNNYRYAHFLLGKKPEVTMYHSFLSAMLKGDMVSISRTAAEITKALQKTPESWILTYLLMKADVKYDNPEEKLVLLKTQFEQGASQIVLYYEAFKIFREEPHRIRKLEEFEVKILNFAAKYQLITKELAVYTANIANQKKEFDPNLFQVLSRAYRLYRDVVILNAICMQLIKGEKRENEYFLWYSEAVNANLKIAKLYEYYMMSVDAENFFEPLPHNIYLYFLYDTSLGHKKTAFLYANLLSNQDEGGELFRLYHERMEKFAWQQLEERNISESLKVVYNRFLSESDMTPERIAALRDICHAYTIKTDYNRVARVMVIEKDGKIIQTVPYKEQGVYIFLHDKESRVILEDRKQVKYVDTIAYEMKRLFFEPKYVDMYKKYEPKHYGPKRKLGNREISFENLAIYPISDFDELKALHFCAEMVDEIEYRQNGRLEYICFALLKNGQYNDVTLGYLCKYYSGPTQDMRLVWNTARKYGADTDRLAERIITQMIYAENVNNEEEIFRDFYDKKPNFRVKKAYFVYVGREYVMESAEFSVHTAELLLREYNEEETLPDVSEIAVLKYYATNEYREEHAHILKNIMRDLCEKHIFFPFYMRFPEQWMREFQLYDKIIVSYRARGKNAVKIHYRVEDENEKIIEEREEVLLPVYENIYVKSLVAFADERAFFKFSETIDETEMFTIEKSVKGTKGKMLGRYGKLNTIFMAKEEEKRKAAMSYLIDEKISEQLFRLY